MRVAPDLPRDLFALLVLLTACASDGGRPDSTTVTDSAGVSIVASTGVDQPLPWVLTELVQIGGGDEGATSFTTASKQLVRTNGRDRIIVFDRDRSVLEVFSGSGEPIATLGGKGGGPGEMEMAFELLDAGANEIVVFDFSKMAMVRWSMSGEVLPERRLPEALGGWYGLAVRGDTAILTLEDSDSVLSRYRVVITTGPDTVVVDSVFAPPRKMSSFTCFSAMLPPLFSTRPVWATHDGVLAVTRQAEYSVQLYRGGRLASVIRRPLTPAATSPDAAARLHPDGMKVQFGGGGECVVPSSEVAEKAGMEPRLPVISDLAFGPRGTLWVARHAFPGDSVSTDVFDREGTYLGTMVGRGLPLGWLGDDRVLFPIADEESGVSIVGVYRITN